MTNNFILKILSVACLTFLTVTPAGLLMAGGNVELGIACAFLVLLSAGLGAVLVKAFQERPAP